MTTDRLGRRPTRWGGLVLAVLLALTTACGDEDTAGTSGPDATTTTASARATETAEADDGVSAAHATIVLVHGAFAGPDSWDGVVPVLEAEGHEVVVPELPLRSVGGDTDVLRSVLDDIDGPVVLAAHSYGGIIASGAAVDDPDVEALVFVAAFAPDEGESIIGILEEYPGSAAGPDSFVLEPYTKDDGTEGTNALISPDVFADVFAADLPADVAAGAAESQHPIDFDALGEGAGPPGWTSIPSWYLIATADQIIPGEATHAMAERAGSVIAEVDASHAVALSQPDAVVDVIDDALASVG